MKYLLSCPILLLFGGMSERTNEVVLKTTVGQPTGGSNPSPSAIMETSKSLLIAKKYLGQKVRVVFDRPLGSKHPKYGFVYEVNYGYLPGVKAPDGEDLDAYYLSSNEPLQEAEGICIAIVHREDDDDDKLVIVSENVQLTDEEILKAVNFQEQWFESTIVRD